MQLCLSDHGKGEEGEKKPLRQHQAHYSSMSPIHPCFISVAVHELQSRGWLEGFSHLYPQPTTLLETDGYRNPVGLQTASWCQPPLPYPYLLSIDTRSPDPRQTSWANCTPPTTPCKFQGGLCLALQSSKRRSCELLLCHELRSTVTF